MSLNVKTDHYPYKTSTATQEGAKKISAPSMDQPPSSSVRTSPLSFKADPFTLGVVGTIANTALTVIGFGVAEKLISKSYVRNKAGYLSSILKHLDDKVKLMQNNPQQAKSYLVKEYKEARSYLYGKFEKYFNPYSSFYKWHKIVPKTDFTINEKKAALLVEDLKLKGFPNAAQMVQDHLRYDKVKKIVDTLPKT